MTQYDPGLFEPTDSGMQLATDLNGLVDSLRTNHKGPARPSYVRPGTLWIDDAGAAWLLKLYDGTEDAILATIDPATHAVTSAGVPATRKVKTGAAFLLNGAAGTNEAPAEADLTADLLFKLIFASVADTIAGEREDLPVHPAGLKAAIEARGSSLDALQDPIIFNTSGSWVVPAGMTRVLAVLFGGGGGGGNGVANYSVGGYGGFGGVAVKVMTVTPGDVLPVVIGAGGNWGSAGGKSEFNGLTANYGDGGTNGSGSAYGTTGANGTGIGGDYVGRADAWTSLKNFVASRLVGVSSAMTLNAATYATNREQLIDTNGSPIIWTPAGPYLPGGRGQPGTNTSRWVYGAGGIGGALFIYPVK